VSQRHENLSHSFRSYRIAQCVADAMVSTHDNTRIRVGISGWRYGPWRGAFYPESLPQRLELAYASRLLPSIEINGSFYSLQRPEYYAQWFAETPLDFEFAAKGPRFITHMKRLKNPKTPLANFFASGVFNLRHKLGPILWQFPPQLRFDRHRFSDFLALLPRDTHAALRLARGRDARLRGRSRLAIDAARPLRHAFEIRHESFLDPKFVALLRAHNAALVIAEAAQRWPMPQDITADFVYLRLHGDKTLYQSGYSDRALQRWADRIGIWHRGGDTEGMKITETRPRKRPRDVYCYFDNTDVKLRAPVDAQTLMKKLNLRPRSGRSAVLKELLQKTNTAS
jgi:uncharacterized protein YecE (DUF72 family)